MSYWDNLPPEAKIYTLSDEGFDHSFRKGGRAAITCCLAFNTVTGEIFPYTACKRPPLEKCWQDEEPWVADMTGYDIVELGCALRPVIYQQAPALVDRIQTALAARRLGPAMVIPLVRTFH